MGQSQSWFGSVPDETVADAIESDLLVHGFTVNKDPYNKNILTIKKDSLKGVIECSKVVRLMGGCTHYCTLTLNDYEEQTYSSYQKLVKELVKKEQDMV